MARNRNVVPISGNTFYTHISRGTPAPVRKVLEEGGPAMNDIITELLAARLVGDDTTDPAVLARCIRDGKAKHDAREHGGDAA